MNADKMPPPPHHAEAQHKPGIRMGILDSNTLTGLGLQGILEEIIPVAEISLLQSFEELLAHETEHFVHFFVSSRIYFEHAQYFCQCKTPCIVLVNGDMSINGVKTINVCQQERKLVQDILSLQQSRHGPNGTTPMNTAELRPHHPTKATPATHLASVLSARETEVAILLAKGLINKEIADRLSISLTTVITHRKNIMDKLGARSLADIIIHVVMNGLADVSDL